ncbi:MAG: 7TM diverse intracellular signaling domain-containing protein [Bacteroidia bacterium]
MKRAAIAFCLLFLHTCLFSQTADKYAVLDLSRWNTAENAIIQLDQQWEIYANNLLTPADFKKDSALAPDALVKPSAWNDLKINGQAMGGKGFVTYRLQLKNLPAADLILDVYSVQTSCRIFINDSLMLEIGKPGTTKENTSPMTHDGMVHLPANSRNVQVIVQIANFHHRKGGFVHPFEIGLAQPVVNHHVLYYLLSVSESSVLLILGSFLFALYVFRRKDLSILYFSLFCISLSPRPVTAVNYFLGTVFPDMSWSLLLKIEYSSVLFPCLFMVLFIKQLFPEQLSSFFVKFFKWVFIVMVAITVIFPPSVFSWLIPPLLIIIPFGVIILAITIIKAVKAKVEGANYAGLGIIVLLISLVLKVLVYASMIPLIHVLITTVDIIFIFMMSLILGARFSLQFAKVERLQQMTEIQRREIELKKEAIEEQNKNITASINYARRIQMSLLPTEKYIEKTLNKLRGKSKS